MQQTECCSESRIRSRTSRGVPEWSGGKENYIGSVVSAIGKVSGSPVLYQDHRMGPGGPTGGATHPGGPHGLKWGGEPAHGALRDRWPHPVGPPDPSRGPGTIPVTPETFRMAEITLPIYNSLPPDHSGTPRDVRDLIRDSEQHSVYCILIFIQP